MVNLTFICLLFLFGVAALLLPKEWGAKRFTLAMVLFAFSAAYAVSTSYVVVDEGHEGVVLSFGAAKEVPLSPGLKWKYPWETVEQLSVQDIKFENTYQCSSNDLQEVAVDMIVVYRLKRGATPQIYEQVGRRWEGVDIAPGAQEVLKQMTAQYNATEIVQKRSELSLKTRAALADWIEAEGLELVDCSIAKSTFSRNFNIAISDKQNALEDANKAVNQLAEAKERAKIARTDARGKADAVIEDALGEAAQIKRSADAESFEIRRSAEAKVKELRGVGLAEAYRLAKMVEALKLNPGVVELEAIKAWQGAVPSYKISTESGKDLNLLLPTPDPQQKRRTTPTSAKK